MCFFIQVATCVTEDGRMANWREFQPGKYLAEHGWIVSSQEALSAVWIRCKQSSWQNLLPPSKKHVPSIYGLLQFSGQWSQWRSRVSDWLRFRSYFESCPSTRLLFQTILQVDVAPAGLDGFGLLFPGGVVAKLGYTAVKWHEVAQVARVAHLCGIEPKCEILLMSWKCNVFWLEDSPILPWAQKTRLFKYFHSSLMIASKRSLSVSMTAYHRYRSGGCTVIVNNCEVDRHVLPPFPVQLGGVASNIDWKPRPFFVVIQS